MIAREPVPIELQPHNPALLSHAFWSGMEAKDMELTKWVPKAKHYRDRVSGHFASLFVNNADITADNKLIDCRWSEVGASKWVSGDNLFLATVDGISVEIEVLYDQPDGRKVGDKVRWQPQLFLNGVEQFAKKPTLFDIDPYNQFYNQNVIEWDYGICQRRLRIIEGKVREKWVFIADPKGDVSIVHNQSGDYKLKIGSAMSSNGEDLEVEVINEDEEFVSAKEFARVDIVFPVEVKAITTFNPDADAETASVDGRAWETGEEDDWSVLVARPGDGAADDGDFGYAPSLKTHASTSGKWKALQRSIFVFDTSSLPDGDTISAATFSIYGESKGDELSVTPDVNVYSSSIAADPHTSIAAGDFDSLGAVAFCDTPITYAGYNTGTPGTINNFVFNATGIAAISKTAVTELGTRNANYDVADENDPGNHNPNWTADKISHLSVWYTEEGAGYLPVLSVTHAAVAGLSIPIAMHHYKQMLGQAP